MDQQCPGRSNLFSGRVRSLSHHKQSKLSHQKQALGLVVILCNVKDHNT